MRPAILAILLAACAPFPDDVGTQDTAQQDTATDTGAGTADTSSGDTGPDTAPVDADGDGFTADEDCDDTDAEVHPGATEVCDDVDNDCNGSVDEGQDAVWYVDSDGDGYGVDDDAVRACEAPEGYTDNVDDCDDTDSTSNPGAAEDCDTDTDNDCDGFAACDDDDCEATEACVMAECETATTSLGWTGAAEYTTTDSGTANLGQMSGYGSVCSASCSAGWVFAYIARTETCTTGESYPVLVEGADVGYLCLEVVAPASTEWASCSVVWGDGSAVIDVRGG